MAMREAHPQTLALAAAAMGSGHVRRRPGLVDKDKACRIEIELPAKPVPALPQDVRAILFDGMAGLFFRVMP
jgi:hypothetical protein